MHPYHQMIAVGTVQFGLPYGLDKQAHSPISVREAASILALASKHGIRTVDTAAAYGESENILGHTGHTDIDIVTKLPPIPIGTTGVEAWTHYIVENSLRNLNRDSLYGLLLHKSADLTGEHGEVLYRTLCRLRDRGLVKKIGWSIYRPQDIHTLPVSYHADIVQFPFNILDRRMEQCGLLQQLSENGTELHARSIFLQGLLLRTPDERPTYFNKWGDVWTDWQEYLAEVDKPPISVALSYCWANPLIDKLVIGIRSSKQLADILALNPTELPPLPPSFDQLPETLLNPSLWNLQA